MLNEIALQGRFASDPILRRTAAGDAVTSFTLAVERDIPNRDGERGTDFIDCIAWRGTGEFVARNFAKGKMAIVKGRLAVRKFEDKDGNKRSKAEVVADSVYFVDSKPNDSGTKRCPETENENENDFSEISLMNDSLPF